MFLFCVVSLFLRRCSVLFFSFLASLTYSATTPDGEAAGPAEADGRVGSMGLQSQRQAQTLLSVA